MALKATTIGSTDPTQPGTAVEESERLLQSTLEQEIRDRAYEIYLQRGAQSGYEVEDWLQAEREVNDTIVQLVSFSRTEEEAIHDTQSDLLGEHRSAGRPVGR